MDAKWRKICSEVWKLVWSNPDAWIFHNPVIESPDIPHESKVLYQRVITDPMDLRTVKRNLAVFESPGEFETEICKIFRNCEKFNKPGQDAFEMGKDVERDFRIKWEMEGRRTQANRC